MKLHQKTITFTLDPKLSDDLFATLKANPDSELVFLRRVLRNGLDVEQGLYHDKDMKIIMDQNEATQNSMAVQSNLLKKLQVGLADVQDTIADQQTDADFLLK